jgi:hypothetical protein
MYPHLSSCYLTACLTRRVEAQLRWQAGYQGSTVAFLNALSMKILVLGADSANGQLQDTRQELQGFTCVKRKEQGPI